MFLSKSVLRCLDDFPRVGFCSLPLVLPQSTTEKSLVLFPVPSLQIFIDTDETPPSFLFSKLNCCTSQPFFIAENLVSISSLWPFFGALSSTCHSFCFVDSCMLIYAACLGFKLPSPFLVAPRESVGKQVCVCSATFHSQLLCLAIWTLAR